MLEVACCPLTANVPSVPQVNRFFWWPTSTGSRAVRHLCVSFLLAMGRGNHVPCAAVWPLPLCGTCHGSRSILLLSVCVCIALQGQNILQLYCAPPKKRTFELVIMMNFTAYASAAWTTSTGSCWHEKGAKSMQVRACMRMLSPPNDSAMCSLACQRGFLWLTGYPHLIPIFYGDHSRTPGSLERRAP